MAQIAAQGVAILQPAGDALLDRFERSLSGLSKLNVDMTDWENRWNLRWPVARHPDGVSARTKWVMEAAERMSVEDYQRMLRERQAIVDDHVALASRADAAIAPSSPGSAPRWPSEPPLPVPTGNQVFNAPSSLLGAPAVTSPLTAVHGLPMGIQVMGQRGQDSRMTAIAHWLREAIVPVSE